jgi:hypothetical protein
VAFDDDDGDYEGESAFDHHAEIVTVEIRDDHAYITIETDEGEVVHIGEHGGVTLDWLEQYYDDYGDDWADAILDDLWDELYG